MTQPDTTLAGVPRGAGGVAVVTFGGVEAWGVFVSLLYIAAAGVLTGWWHLGSAEALARTAHVGNLWGGFDQTAMAFGLERPPLLTGLTVPFGLMPILRDHGLAAALGTASVGGLGVSAASSLARWAGFGTITHALFTIAFVAHPLLVLSAASGLPEALYASLLLIALTQFMRWADRDAIAPVIVSGATLGLAFMVRYNVVLFAGALALAYLLVARNRGDHNDRIERSQATTFAFLIPVVFVAGFWVITSWFATGNAFGFLRDASRLSDLAGNDPVIAEHMREMRGNPLEVLRWLGRWLPLVAAPSLLAIAALVVTGLARRSVTALALGLVLASLVLPEALSLLAGHGQPRVPHLFPLVVPVFVAVAYFEHSRTQGRRPEAYERGASRRQAMLALLLLVTSAASVAAFPFLPREESPARELADRAREGRLTSVAANPDGVAATAEWIRTNAERGDVIVDPERNAEVMVATRNFSRFRTPTDDGGLAVVADPSSASNFILARKPVAGRGALERIYPRLYEAGAPTLDLEFEAGEYRIYRVRGAEQGR